MTGAKLNTDIILYMSLKTRFNAKCFVHFLKYMRMCDAHQIYL